MFNVIFKTKTLVILYFKVNYFYKLTNLEKIKKNVEKND